jgi:hypothetical protein
MMPATRCFAATGYRLALGFGLAAGLVAGCTKKPEPVIPHAAFIERHDHRDAIEGADTTLARLTWPECMGARTPVALDSLRAAVSAMALAPTLRHARPARNIAALLDGFIAEWNAERKATRRRMFWRFDRRIEVIGDTMGVVSLSRTDFEFTGGAHPVTSVTLGGVDADSGRAIRFADLFREDALDSLSAALEPLFRDARGLTRDTSLAAAGFFFANGRFRANQQVAIVPDGVRWHFDAVEIAPYAWGPTDFVAPFELVRRFAKPGGPLASERAR